jgi:23S rRNA pseudouridine2605 synthase
MRLNKYISNAGLASRRKADELIQEGKVKVNGKTMDQLGYLVSPEDRVEVNGAIIEPSKKRVYIMLNKPKGYITSVSDEKDRLTVTDLISDVDARLFPVGRLDYNTSGLLILTNDGEFAYQMTHPKYKVEKTYLAKVAGIISDQRLSRLRKGIDIGGFVTSPAKVTVVKQMEKSTLIEIKIYEGRNRQIRKMFAAVGNKVIELQRIGIGELLLGHLKEGHYRKLSKQEVDSLLGK